MLSESPHEPAIVYVMFVTPGPATAGSNAPVDVLVIPVPAHTPPPSTAVKTTAASFSQKGPAAVIVALAPAVIITLTLVEVGHGPFVKYVMVKVLAPEALKSITPVVGFIVPPLLMLNVPPAKPVIVGIGSTSVRQ